MRSGVDGDIMESFDVTAAGTFATHAIYIYTYICIFVAAS